MGTHNILIVADSGHHKTWFLSTCPKPFIFDFDIGLQVANMETRFPNARFRDIPKQFLGGYQTEMEKEGLYKPGLGWLNFIKKLNEVVDGVLKKKLDIQTIGLDSLSFMQELAMSKILKDTDQEFAHKGSYGAQQKYLKEVLDILTILPVNVVATAHIQRDENDLTKIVEKLPLLTGKLAGFIGAYFQEVWFVEAVEDLKHPSGTGMKFIIHNKALGFNKQAKSRKNVPDGTELDWKYVSPFLEGKDKNDPIPKEEPSKAVPAALVIR